MKGKLVREILRNELDKKPAFLFFLDTSNIDTFMKYIKL